MPAASIAADETVAPDLERDLLACAEFRGLKRFFCLDEVLHALESAPESLKGRSEKFFKTPGDWIGSARISEPGSNDVQLPYLLLFDKNIPGGRSSHWPFQPAHAFVISCSENGYQAALFLQGLPLLKTAGGNIVQFKVDKTPTQTLFLDAEMTNRFFVRMTASGEGVATLIESIKTGTEMTVWATIRPKDEVRLTFPIAKAAENLAVVDSTCGP